MDYQSGIFILNGLSISKGKKLKSTRKHYTEIWQQRSIMYHPKTNAKGKVQTYY